MVKDGVYFENQKKKIKKLLLTAEKSVKIAVAWINFDDYNDVLISLLNKKVKIKILINDDIINKKYSKIINELTKLGAKIKFISMPSKKSYMHHKFCIIDNTLVMAGSFNWTKNANNNNYEDLIVSHDKTLLLGYITQFKTIFELTKEDLKILKNPERCETCKEPIIIICVFDQEGYNETKADLYEVCDCRIDKRESDYFDITVYSSIVGILDKYNEVDDWEQYGNNYKEELNEQIDFEINDYLSNIRKNRMNYPIIHAVGIYGSKQFSRDDWEPIIKVLWKERYTYKHILDEYILE